MKNNLFRLPCFILFICFCGFNSVNAENISYVGSSTCDLNYSFKAKMFRLPIENIKPEHAIEYRKIHKQKYLLIINGVKEIGGCGTIISQFQLPKMRTGESVEFKCTIKERHQDTNNVIIGIADNKAGKVRFVNPRLAWSLDLEKMNFVKINAFHIICDTTGYAE
jgi:hypothetical protein